MIQVLSMSVGVLAIAAAAGGSLWYRRRRIERDRVRRDLLRGLGEVLARAKGRPEERTIELLVLGLYGLATKGRSLELMATMADLLDTADTLRPRPAIRPQNGDLLGGDLAGVLLASGPAHPPGTVAPRPPRPDEPTEPIEDRT